MNPPPPQRQANHVVSEDQDDIEVAQPVAVETVRDGITVKLLKEQLHQVKETDTRSAKTDPEVASLLERFLAEALLFSEMEKLSKKHPPVENVPIMHVQRLDPEDFQEGGSSGERHPSEHSSHSKRCTRGHVGLHSIVGVGFQEEFH